MAMAGFEIILKGLFQNRRELQHQQFIRIAAIAHNVDIPPIKPPKISIRQTDRWLRDQALFRFLGVHKYDESILKAWMVEGKAVVGLADQLALIRLLRNCTVHAVLSAHKCKELGLKPALLHLPEHVAKAWIEIVTILCAD